MDLIINVPKMKTHTLVGFTGVIKDMYGIILGGTKQEYHKLYSNPQVFSDMLVDIYNFKVPDITIMDGIEAMEGDGPSAGNITYPKKLLISKNGFALDFVCEKLLNYKPDFILTNKVAKKRNLIPKNITISGDYKSIFQIPTGLSRKE